MSFPKVTIIALVIIINPHFALVAISPSNEHKVHQIHSSDAGDNKHGADVAGDTPRDGGQRVSDANHVLREFLVVELYLSEDIKRFGEAHRDELREQPRDGDGRIAAVSGGACGSASLDLDETRHHHGEDGDGEPDAHPLEDGDAADDARVAPGPRDKDAVVEGEPDGDGDEGDDEEGAGRDLEAAAAEVAVHLHGLIDCEGALLNYGDRRHHPSYTGKNTPFRLHINIAPHAEKEQHDPADHEPGGDPEPNHPAHTILDINHHRHADYEHRRERHVVPVEETANAFPTLRRGRVELVYAERDAARPYSASADGQEAQPHYEIAQLGTGRALALLAARRAGWWTHRRASRYGGQRHHSLSTT
nr:uncharacterized protein LOC112343166 [Ipomoea batatas]